ncbi:MAG: toll/interleukin-1 receptor domain-containing protein [Alphaproteobacteria bacterium]|nr:toll/interleukin-1 receptor domain-containing protein [Alphaproteobacteria bacterium]
MFNIKFEIDGKRVDPNNSGAIEEALSNAAFKNVGKQIHDRLATVRDPETGRFAVVSVEGTSLENMRIAVEGSQAVVDLVIERVRELGMTADSVIRSHIRKGDRPIYVFLSHANADSDTAIEIAKTFNAKGIEVFLDKWDIRAGDSIPEKINDALNQATHFVVLLTPKSQAREWVKAEMDAGLMLRIEGRCQFIALRQNMPATNLPPLVRSWNSPSLDDFETDIAQLVSDILGISRRPPLGPLPTPLAVPRSQSLLLSPAAMMIARTYIQRSETGRLADPQIELEELVKESGLTDEDLIDAIDELSGKGYVKTLKALGRFRLGCAALVVQPALFSELDHLIMQWNPAEDAQLIAADMVNEVIDGNVQKAAEHYHWSARRINPAITYLIRRRLIQASNEAPGGTPWCAHWITAIPETRRFVKAKSGI